MSLKSLIRDRSARLFRAVTLVAGFGSTAMSLTSSVWVLVFAPLTLTITAGAGLIAIADHRLPLVIAAAARLLVGVVLLRRRAQPAVLLTRVGMSTADSGG